MSWTPSHRKEVWESRGWRGRWRRQGRGVEDGRSMQKALEMLKNTGEGDWKECVG